MAALQKAKYGFDNLYLFPIYQTQDQYKKATGLEPPTYDESKPAKYWFDAAAAQSVKRLVLYDNVLAIDEAGRAVAGPDDQPYLEPLMLTKQDAATVNIPVGVLASGAVPIAPPVPVPVRPLEPEEELFFEFPRVVMVRNRNFAEAAPVAYSEKDRELLRAIGRKLGVTV